MKNLEDISEEELREAEEETRQRLKQIMERKEAVKQEKLMAHFKKQMINEPISWITAPSLKHISNSGKQYPCVGTYINFAPREGDILIPQTAVITIIIPNTWVEYTKLVKVTITPVSDEEKKKI